MGLRMYHTPVGLCFRNSAFWGSCFAFSLRSSWAVYPQVLEKDQVCSWHWGLLTKRRSKVGFLKVFPDQAKLHHLQKMVPWSADSCKLKTMRILETANRVLLALAKNDHENVRKQSVNVNINMNTNLKSYRIKMNMKMAMTYESEFDFDVFV